MQWAVSIHDSVRETFSKPEIESSIRFSRVETTEKWQQVDAIGGSRIASVSKHGIHVWNLTKIHEHYCTTRYDLQIRLVYKAINFKSVFDRAKPSYMRRIECTAQSPARLLVASADGAVRIFSAVNGASICTVLPPQSDATILDVVYDVADSMYSDSQPLIAK